MKTKIFVICHKNVVKIKKENYLYIQSGAFYNASINCDFRDNVGDNISYKNKQYNELCDYYWVWKNYKDYDNVGFCHYRRFFCKYPKIKRVFNIRSSRNIEKILYKYDIILAKQDLCAEKSLYEKYYNSKNIIKEDFTTFISVLKKYPDVYNFFDKIMNDRALSYYNMFVMKKKDFEKYCSFLFQIVDEVYELLKSNKREGNTQRYIGYFSEILLNVWVNMNSYNVYYSKVKTFKY